MTVDDGRTRQMPVNAWAPAQRAGGSPAHSAYFDEAHSDGAHSAPASHALSDYDLATPQSAPPSHAAPSWPARDETMVLPTFVTAPKVTPEPAPAPEPPASTAPSTDTDRLPSTERNMLIFVSLLLAIGTLAIVAMASVGR